MKSILLTLCICLAPHWLHAQTLGGDNRNTTVNMGKGMGGDTAMHVQNGSDGNPKAVGGVTIKKGEKVSINGSGGLASETPGFWRGEKDAKYTALFRDENGKDFVLVELHGLVRWDAKGNVTEGKENFLRVATANNASGEADWLPVISTELVDGKLTVKIKDESRFALSKLSFNFSGNSNALGK